MAGFNYGGGAGDGTGWSSERGSEPSPGGGQQGNAGDHDSSANSGNGNKNGNNGVKTVPQDRGDAISRAAGIDPGFFNYYYINEDSDLIGVSSLLSVGFEELNDFSPGGVNLGQAPADLLHDYGNSGNGTSGIHNMANLRATAQATDNILALSTRSMVRD